MCKYLSLTLFSITFRYHVSKWKENIAKSITWTKLSCIDAILLSVLLWRWHKVILIFRSSTRDIIQVVHLRTSNIFRWMDVIRVWLQRSKINGLFGDTVCRQIETSFFGWKWESFWMICGTGYDGGMICDAGEGVDAIKLCPIDKWFH